MRDRYDPTYVLAQLEQLAHTQPDVWEDAELRALTIASETNTEEFLGTLAYHIGLIEGYAEGTATLISNARTRKERFDAQAEGLRALALKLMDAAGTKKLVLPIATLSIHAGVPKVVITDFNALPESCIRTKREPDKVMIKHYLEQHGHGTVPGASLSNAEPYLNVRKK